METSAVRKVNDDAKFYAENMFGDNGARKRFRKHISINKISKLEIR